MENKKTYTTEDNIRSMLFALKDLVKSMEKMQRTVESIECSMQKTEKSDNIPF